MVRIGAETVEVNLLRFINDAVPRILESLPINLPVTIRSALIGGKGALLRTENANVGTHLDEQGLTTLDRQSLVLPDVS